MRVLAIPLILAASSAVAAAQNAAPPAARRAAAATAKAEPATAARMTEAQLQREYGRRVAAVAAGDHDARVALATWCKARGLYTEMRREVHRVLRAAPDHAGARALLGHEKVKGKWLTRAEAMRARGYVRFRGQWMRKYDVARLKHAEAQQRRRKAFERELDASFAQLASRSGRRRAAALEALERIADRRECPLLADLARRQHAKYERYWREFGYSLVTMSLNLQHSELLGLTPFTTSIGQGTPVTIQLPRMRTTSIGTTVTVPAGRGR